MVTRAQIWKLHEMGIQTDMFGRRIKKGDLVLTKNYGSPDKDIFAVVKKVNKKTIVVDVMFKQTTWGKHVSRPPGHTGQWNYYPDRKTTMTVKEMKRQGIDTLIVSQEFYDAAEAEGENLVDEYPEAFI